MKCRSIFFAFVLGAIMIALAAAATPPHPTVLAASAAALPAPATAKVMFRGTEYFLRTSSAHEYEFTPAGQEAMENFTDMLALDLYPAAHDQEALATITSRVAGLAAGAKATVLRTVSVPASGQQPGQHFFAATRPTSRGADFDAAQFVLVDGHAVGVFYTRRAYGPTAAATTTAWATKNLADVEQQLSRFDASTLVSAAKVPASPSVPVQNADLPAGTIKKGTLTSPQLMHDTTLGVVSKVGMLGCKNVEGFTPYVVTPFSGATGVRQWQEKWLVKGCGKEYPVDIGFKEDGAGGADWTIKN